MDFQPRLFSCILPKRQKEQKSNDPEYVQNKFLQEIVFIQICGVVTYKVTVHAKTVAPAIKALSIVLKMNNVGRQSVIHRVIVALFGKEWGV